MALLQYPNTTPGSAHALFLKEVESGIIVARPEDIWKFNAPQPDVVRARAAAKGEDPETAVACMPPPAVWLRKLPEDSVLRSDGKWRDTNDMKGRNCGAICGLRSMQEYKVGQWFEDYGDEKTGVELQCKVWVAPQRPRAPGAERGRGRGRGRGGAGRGDRDGGGGGGGGGASSGGGTSGGGGRAGSSKVSFCVPCDEDGRTLTLAEYLECVTLLVES
jgi:uncharacterized membrane protein YgcG